MLRSFPARILILLCVLAGTGFSSARGAGGDDPVGEDLEAAYERGRELFNTEKRPEALRVWQEGLAAAERAGRMDEAGRMHLGLALFAAWETKDLARAEAECLLALKLNPSLTQAHALLGQVLLDLDRLADAERELNAGLGFERWKTRTLHALAIVLRLEKKRDEALATVRAWEAWVIAKPDPSGDEAEWLGIARQFWALDLTQEAERTVNKSLASRPTFSACTLLGDQLREQKKYPEAEVAFRRALELAPADTAAAAAKVEVLRKLAGCCLERNAPEGALPHLREAERLAPDDPQVQLGLAIVWEQLKSDTEAEAALKRMVALREDFAGLHRYANFCYQRGRWKEVKELDKKALAKADARPGEVSNTDRAEALFNLGRTARFRSAHEESLGYLNQAAGLAPEDGGVQAVLGLCLASLGKFPEAEAAFRRAWELRPRAAQIAYHYGNFLLERGRFEEAAAMLRKALELTPDDVDTLLLLSSALQRSQLNDTPLQRSRKNEEALVALLRAESLTKTNQEVYWRLGITLGGMDRPVEAEAAFQQALKVKPTFNGYYYFGLFMRRQDKPAEAEKLLRQAVELIPDDCDALGELANVLKGLDRYEESAEIARRSIQLREKAGQDSMYEFGILAMDYDQLGRQDEAIAMLRKLLSAVGSDERTALRQIYCLGEIARILAKESRYQEAVDTFQQVLELWQQAQGKGLIEKISEGSKMYLTASEKEMGNALRNLRRYDDAVARYTQAIQDAGQLKPSPDRDETLVNLHLDMGQVFADKSDHPSAIRWYREALRLAQENKLGARMQMDALADLVYPLRNNGEFDEAARCQVKFLELLNGMTDETQRNGSLKSAASLYQAAGEFDKALECQQRRILLTRKRGRMSDLGYALEDLGDAFKQLGRYEEALEAYNESLTVRQRLPHPYGAASCLQEIGRIYEALGDYPKARASFERARDTFQQIKRPDSVASCWVELADVDTGIGDYDAAAADIKRARQIYHDLNDRAGEARQLNNLAIGLEDRKEYGKALDLFQQALEMKRHAGMVLFIYTTLNGIGRQHMFLGDLVKADEFISQSLYLASRAKLAGRDDIQESMAELRIKQKRFAEAKTLLLELTAKESKGGHAIRWGAWHLLGQAHKNLGETDDALKAFKTSIDIIEKVRRATLGQAGDAHFVERYHDVYQDLFELLVEKKDLKEAYYYMTLEKITEFQQNNPDRTISFGDEEKNEAYQRGRGLQFSEVRLQQEISTENAKAHPDPTVLARLEELLEAAHEKFTAYLDGLGHGRGEDFREVKEQLYVDPRELYKSIDNIPDGVFIVQPVLLRAQRQIAILVYSSGAPLVRTVPVPDEQAVQDQLGTLLNVLREPPMRGDRGRQEELEGSAGQFYDWLIAPIEDVLASAKLLVISPSGKLRKIPFQALYDRKKQQYLVEKCPLVNLAMHPGERRAAPASVRIFAVSNPDGTLAGADEQVDRMQQIFPAAKVFRHQEATLDCLRWRHGGTAERYNVLLFATHATIVDDEPGQSNILLANGEKLTYEKIPSFRFSWRPEVELVVLSACSTAVALNSENSAMHSLAAQFELIGIRSIIATLWQVHDASTADLMTRLFVNLKAHQPLPVALQQAQLTLLRSAKYRDPYYWAPFILLSDWRQTVDPATGAANGLSTRGDAP